MGTRTTLGLMLLGALMLGSGCFYPYHYGHEPVYAPRHNPGAFWTGVGLARAGDAALCAAGRQTHPAAVLATAAVGLGLHVAAAGTIHHAYHAPPRLAYTDRYSRYEPGPRSREYHECDWR